MALRGLYLQTPALSNMHIAGACCETTEQKLVHFAARGCKIYKPEHQVVVRGDMVELEDVDPAGFSLWVDGNQPSSYGTLPHIVSRRYLLEAGVTEPVLRRYNLWPVKQ